MFDEMRLEMEQILKVVQDDLSLVRTGRAKPNLIEQVKVEAYPGTVLPLIELANISAPDSHLLMVQPWDQSILKAVEAGLRKSDLNLNPVVDGQVIRISIPALTEERRLDLVKLTHQKIESGREMLRDARNKTKKEIDGKKGTPDVSEDDIKLWLTKMQDLHDEYMKRLEILATEKEKELMAM